MTNTHTPVLNAVRRRSASLQVEVMAKNTGTPPKGSTIGNSARNVAADASSTLVEVFGRLLGRTPLSTREGVAAAAE